MTSLRDRIFGTDDTTREVITIPEWGHAEIEIRSMSGIERAEFLKATRKPDGQPADYAVFYPAVCIACCYDPESGERLFTEADKDALNLRNSRALERIARKAMAISGIANDSLDEAGNGSSATKS